MKKGFTSLLCLLVFFTTFSQTGRFKNVELNSKKIDDISLDTSFSNATHYKLATQKATKDYIDNRMGLFDAYVHQALDGYKLAGAFSGTSYRLKNLKPGVNTTLDSTENSITINSGRFGIEDNTSTLNRSMFLGNNYFDMIAGGNLTGIYSRFFQATGSVYGYAQNASGLSSRFFIQPDYALISSSTADESLQLKISPTVATLKRRADVERNLALSVNGNYADSNNNITISVGSGGGSTPGLHEVTNTGWRTSNKAQLKGLIIGDTTQTIPALDNTITGGYNNTGTLSTDSLASGAIAFGTNDSGTIRASNRGAIALGIANASTATIQAAGSGSLAQGFAGWSNPRTNLSYLKATGDGSYAHGYTTGTLLASGNGSSAIGYVNPGATLSANSFGSYATGYAGTNSTLMASSFGSVAMGSSSGGTGITGIPSTITASGTGAIAMGSTSSFGSITSTNAGSIAMGKAQRKATLNATNAGAIAMGIATDSLANGTFSSINATNIGSIAMGYAGKAGFGEVGSINSTARGTFAIGFAQDGAINASQDGAWGGGYNNGTGVITSAGFGSYVWGYVNGTDSIYTIGTNSVLLGGKLYNTGIASQLFGYGLRNTVNNVFLVGNNEEGIKYNGTAHTVSLGVATTAAAGLTVASRFAATGTTPTIAPYTAGAGTGSTASVVGNDIRGQVTITTGTTPSFGATTLAILDFSSAYTSTPIVMISPHNAFAGLLDWYGNYVATGITPHGGIYFSTNTALVASTTYIFNYWVIQ